MFSDVVLFHGGGTNGNGDTTRNVCSSEKMTQTGDDAPWPVLGTAAAGQQVAPQQQVLQQVMALCGQGQWLVVVGTVMNCLVAEFELLTTVLMKIGVFCDVTLSRSCNIP
jgi:hypothetical protein